MSLPVNNFRCDPVDVEQPFITHPNGEKRYNRGFTNIELVIIGFTLPFFIRADELKSERAFYWTHENQKQEYHHYVHQHFPQFASKNHLDLADQIHELWMKTRDFATKISMDVGNSTYAQKISDQFKHADEMSQAFHTYHLSGETFAPVQIEMILKFAQTLPQLKL